jgi:hypothetical protein
VVAADGQQVIRVVQQHGRGCLDLVDGLFDVEGVGRDVAGVGDLLGGERGHVQAGMPGPQQPGALADRGRPEPGAGPVGGAAVERDADHGHVAVPDLVPPRQQRERGRPGEARDLAGVDRSADRIAHRASSTTSSGPAVPARASASGRRTYTMAVAMADRATMPRIQAQNTLAGGGWLGWTNS